MILAIHLLKIHGNLKKSLIFLGLIKNMQTALDILGTVDGNCDSQCHLLVPDIHQQISCARGYQPLNFVLITLHQLILQTHYQNFFFIVSVWV
jgi:hypothetical protein